MKTKEIKIDEKDWFNIDEEIDYNLTMPESEELTEARIKFVHSSLELVKTVKQYIAERNSLARQDKCDIEHIKLDFLPYYKRWLFEIAKYDEELKEERLKNEN